VKTNVLETFFDPEDAVAEADAEEEIRETVLPADAHVLAYAFKAACSLLPQSFRI